MAETEGRPFKVEVGGSITPSGSLAEQTIKRRPFLRTNWALLIIVILISVFSAYFTSFLVSGLTSLVISSCFGIITFILGLYAMERVYKEERTLIK